MKRITRIAAMALVLPLVTAAMAGSDLRFQEDADFAGYRTYAWQKGAPALDERVEGAIVKMVNRELQAKGLSLVESDPDLFVMTYAFGEGQAKADADLGWWNGVNNNDGDNFGVATSQVRVNTKGTLLIKLVDASTDEAVWESRVQKTMGENVSSAIKKVDKMVAKMFQRYPPK